MNGRAIPGAYLFRLYVCFGKRRFRLTNVIPERIIFVSRGITVISRLKKSNEMQQYADIYLLLNYSRCLGRPSRPSSGVLKTVVAASGTDHTIWGASFLKRD